MKMMMMMVGMTVVTMVRMMAVVRMTMAMAMAMAMTTVMIGEEQGLHHPHSQSSCILSCTLILVNNRYSQKKLIIDHAYNLKRSRQGRER